jgi:hypothetical protein
MSETEKQPKPEPKPEPAAKTTGVQQCDLCGNAMYEWHCRIVCPACGYQRDCSDP